MVGLAPDLGFVAGSKPVRKGLLQAALQEPLAHLPVGLVRSKFGKQVELGRTLGGLLPAFNTSVAYDLPIPTLCGVQGVSTAALDGIAHAAATCRATRALVPPCPIVRVSLFCACMSHCEQVALEGQGLHRFFSLDADVCIEVVRTDAGVDARSLLVSV